MSLKTTISCSILAVALSANGTSINYCPKGNTSNAAAFTNNSITSNKVETIVNCQPTKVNFFNPITQTFYLVYASKNKTNYGLCSFTLYPGGNINITGGCNATLSVKNKDYNNVSLFINHVPSILFFNVILDLSAGGTVQRVTIDGEPINTSCTAPVTNQENKQQISCKSIIADSENLDQKKVGVFFVGAYASCSVQADYQKLDSKTLTAQYASWPPQGLHPSGAFLIFRDRRCPIALF